MKISVGQRLEEPRSRHHDALPVIACDRIIMLTSDHQAGGRSLRVNIIPAPPGRSIEDNPQGTPVLHQHGTLRGGGPVCFPTVERFVSALPIPAPNVH